MTHALRSILLASLLAGLLALAAAPAAHAQAAQTRYVQIDYMHVPDDREAAYVELERALYKPLHEERIRRGLITSWGVYRIRFAPPDAPYNYATINVFDDFDKLEEEFPQAIVPLVHPGLDAETLANRTLATRAIVHSEVWQFVVSAQPDGQEAPRGRYLMLNYMSVPPGGEDAYLSLERDLWQSLHQARIDSELMSGWSVYQLMLPRGEIMPYNFGTVDFYDHLGDVAELITEDLMQQAYPSSTDADLATMLERTNATRAIYKSELWERLDATAPPAQ